VNGARDAVIELGVQLGELVAGVDGRLGDVTDGCSLDDVTDDELPDGLVLGATAGAVCAADVLDVSAAVFGASSVASLLRHIEPLKIPGSVRWILYRYTIYLSNKTVLE